MFTLPNEIPLAVYFITLFTGLPLNLIAVYTFSTKVCKKSSPTDIFLLSLTLSDLVFLLFLPFKIHEALNNMIWDLPLALCAVTEFVFFSSIYISTLFLTAVSVDRYLGVAFPIKYKLKRKSSYAVLASFFFWIISTGNCSIVYFVQYLEKYRNVSIKSTECYDNFTNEQLSILLPVRFEMSILLFFVPLLVTIFCYIQFIRILQSLPHIQRNKQQRAIAMAATTVIVYIICFLPYNVSHIVGYIQKESPTWRVAALLPSAFNASLDPIIFYFSSSAVKKNCITFLTRVTKKLGMSCSRLVQKSYENNDCDKPTSTQEVTVVH
ncbi:free fatty acid receptor 2-like [Protopterus annectens]|uniref:free fatty acid receptor 2-like n=1 Tax=Protopterus annectens TaxID=7888 RepID=UPI001CF94CE3|nr:free fatty acid receptor 2-like [Protopterus annectens]